MGSSEISLSLGGDIDDGNSNCEDYSACGLTLMSITEFEFDNTDSLKLACVSLWKYSRSCCECSGKPLSSKPGRDTKDSY
jgi:hypothetical protein